MPTVKVSEHTYRLLVRAKGVLMASTGRQHDFDDVIREGVLRLLREVGGRE